MTGIVKANPFHFFPVVVHSKGFEEYKPWWSGRGVIPKPIMVERFETFRVTAKQEKIAMNYLGKEIDFTLDEDYEAVLDITKTNI